MGRFLIGDGTTQRYLDKEMMVNCHAFVPETTATSYTRAGIYSLINSTTKIAFLFAAVNIPDGVTITKISARVRNNDTGPIGLNYPDIDFYRASTDGATLLDSMQYDTTLSPTWQTIESSAMTEYTSGAAYTIRVGLQSSQATNSQISWAKINYQMPQYDRSI